MMHFDNPYSPLENKDSSKKLIQLRESPAWAYFVLPIIHSALILGCAFIFPPLAGSRADASAMAWAPFVIADFPAFIVTMVLAEIVSSNLIAVTCLAALGGVQWYGINWIFLKCYEFVRQKIHP